MVSGDETAEMDDRSVADDLQSVGYQRCGDVDIECMSRVVRNS